MATSVEPTAAAKPIAPSTTVPASGAATASRDRVLAIGGGIVLLALVGGGLLLWGGRRKEEFAARAMDKALAAVDAGNLPVAAQEFQRVFDNYKGTMAANRAAVMLARVRLENGQTEIAIQGLRDFLKSGPSGDAAASANALLGAALENQGKPAEAADAYLKAADASPLGVQQGEYLLDAGRAQVAAGQKDAAIATYRRITTTLDPKIPAHAEALVRLAELTGGAN